MTTIEQAVRDRIAGLPAVVAIVGSRVYTDALPQSPIYPAVRVVLVDDPEAYHLRGTSGPVQARVQVDAFAEVSSGVDSYDAVTQLAQAIDGNGAGPGASGLSGFIGTVSTVLLAMVRRIDRRRGYSSDEQRVRTISQDYWIRYV